MNSFESNEMEKRAIKQEKRKYKKNPKTARECKVCGRVARFKYYKIQSCEACKQFFRRTIVDQRTFICTKSNSCAINKEDHILVRIERLEKLLEWSGNPTHIPMLERVEKLEKLVERLVDGENHQYGHRFGDAHHHTSITSAPTANNGIQWGQPPPFAGTDAVSQMITEAIINSKQHFVIFN